MQRSVAPGPTFIEDAMEVWIHGLAVLTSRVYSVSFMYLGWCCEGFESCSDCK
jgi:hypothetical protein